MKKIALLFVSVVILTSCFDNQPASDLELVYRIKNINDVLSIAFTSDNTAWVSSFGYGLMKIESDGNIIEFNHENSLISTFPNIWDIEVDSEDRVWFIDDGLVCYDNGNFVRYDSSNSILPHNRIRSIAIDDNDKVWALFEEFNFPDEIKYDLISYDHGIFQLYNDESIDFPYDTLVDMSIDHDNNVWLAGNDHLFKYDGYSWITYNQEDFGFELNNISEIDIDQKNNICVLLVYGFQTPYKKYASSMFIFGPDRTIIFNQEDPDYSDIFVDSENIIWLLGSGEILMYDGVNYSKLNINHSTIAISESPSGEIWIGGNKGVYIYRKNI